MNDTTENKSVNFPGADKEPKPEAITEESLGLTLSGKPSKDASRLELCQTILKMRDLAAGYETAYKRELQRVEIFREEISRVLQAQIKTEAQGVLKETLAGLGVKLG